MPTLFLCVIFGHASLANMFRSAMDNSCTDSEDQVLFAAREGLDMPVGGTGVKSIVTPTFEPCLSVRARIGMAVRSGTAPKRNG